MPPARGKLAIAQATSAETTIEMLELRKQGWTYQAIGDKFGMTAPSAYERVKKALHASVAEPAEDVRQMELERLDHLYQKLSPKVEAGDTRAIQTALSIMDRRAKMLGLDSPVKVEADIQVTDTEQMNSTVYAIIERARSIDGDRPAIHG